MRYARPVGWRGESYRHYLASKGISSGRKRYYAETLLGSALYGAGARMGAGAGGTVERYQDIATSRRLGLGESAATKAAERSEALGESARKKLARGAYAEEAARALLTRARVIGKVEPEERERMKAILPKALAPIKMPVYKKIESFFKSAEEISKNLKALDRDEIEATTKLRRAEVGDYDYAEDVRAIEKLKAELNVLYAQRDAVPATEEGKELANELTKNIERKQERLETKENTARILREANRTRTVKEAKSKLDVEFERLNELRALEKREALRLRMEIQALLPFLLKETVEHERLSRLYGDLSQYTSSEGEYQ